MLRYHLAKIVLTIISSILVGTSLLASDLERVIDVMFLHTLALILVGIIELMTLRIIDRKKDDEFL